MVRSDLDDRIARFRVVIFRLIKTISCDVASVIVVCDEVRFWDEDIFDCLIYLYAIVFNLSDV